MRFIGKCFWIIFAILFFPLFIVDSIGKGVNELARPANGRYGRRSIESRKRSRRRKRRF